MENLLKCSRGNAVAMKKIIISLYGKDSKEAGYIRWVFARRSTDYLTSVYDELVTKFWEVI